MTGQHTKFIHAFLFFSGRTAARQQQGAYPRITTRSPPPSRVPHSQSTSGSRSSQPRSPYSSNLAAFQSSRVPNNSVTTNGSGSFSPRGQRGEPSYTTPNSQPGAFSMRGMSGGRFGSAGNTRETTPYTVIVPANVRSGQQFQVMAGGVPMMVTCPPRAGPGDHVIVSDTQLV